MFNGDNEAKTLDVSLTGTCGYMDYMIQNVS